MKTRYRYNIVKVNKCGRVVYESHDLLKKRVANRMIKKLRKDTKHIYEMVRVKING